MIALALHMLAFLAASLPSGAALMVWLGGGRIERRGDRLILALWLGLLSGGAALLAVALFVPLAPPVLPACLAGGLAFALSPRVREEIRALASARPRAAWLPAVLLLGATAFLGSGSINNRDAISYQHDMIQWLSDLGIVPGLNLVEGRFGYLSSWAAVGAAANHGLMRARAGTLANSLALFLALLQLWIAVARLLARRGRPADVFVAAALPLALGMPLALKVPVSTSPDFPAVVVSVVCAWSYLVLPSPARADAALLPVLLAAGAVVVKLSVAPLLAVAGAHWLVRRPRPAEWGRAVACGAALVVPWMVGMVVVSGCPLYPVPMALDVPWANAEGARIDAELVRNFARWHQGTVPEDAAGIAYPSPAWLRRWLRADVSNAAGFALFVLAMGATAGVAVRRRRMPPGSAWALGTGLAGVAYVVLMAPVPRFGWGFLSIPAGVFLSTVAGPAAGRSRFTERPAACGALAAVLVLLPVLGIGRTAATASERRLRAWMEREAPQALRTAWLVPPEIPLVRYDDKAGTAVPLRGFRPADRLEVSGRPMYFPLEPGAGVRFRDPDRGAASGFEITKDGTR